MSILLKQRFWLKEKITFEITDYRRYEILSTIRFALFQDHLDKFKDYLGKKKNK